MLLIIPAIEIQNGQCVQDVQGLAADGVSLDPVEMARLWRKENAKSLHVTDLDGLKSGRLVNAGLIERMVRAVDIPIELGGGLDFVEEVDRALAAGMYRIVLNTMVLENPDSARQLIERHGPSKIVLGIDAEEGRVQRRSGKLDRELTAIEIAKSAKELGFKRVVYTDIRREAAKRTANFDAIRQLGEHTELHITVSGGVTSLEDLLTLQEMEQIGVDSVVIGRALYENKFACQGLWRLCEAGNYPYTAKV